MEPISGNAQIFREGCEALGIRSAVAPLAILSAPYDGRPPCINRGFCNQGCLPNAKFSTLIQHVPQALSYGAEVLSDSMVTRILVGKDGRVTGVEFVHNGSTYKQDTKMVIVSAFVVETPASSSTLPVNSPRWPGKQQWARGNMPHSTTMCSPSSITIRLYKARQ